MKKVLLTTVMSLMMCMGVYAQTTYEWKKPPKSTEIEIGMITCDYSGGYIQYHTNEFSKEHETSVIHDSRKLVSDEKLYESLLEEAMKKYGETYPKLALRNFKSSMEDNKPGEYNTFRRSFHCSATVVIPDPIAETNENLSRAIDKAFRNVRQGSRIAIDQVTVWSGLNREDYKDLVIDALLDKGYKVVAKEYLEKLYEEQQAQQSGIYNDRTTVQENNFSAVGYYINVKVTETSLRVQVVNVSTGEYEGNATVNF